MPLVTLTSVNVQTILNVIVSSCVSRIVVPVDYYKSPPIIQVSNNGIRSRSERGANECWN